MRLGEETYISTVCLAKLFIWQERDWCDFSAITFKRAPVFISVSHSSIIIESDASASFMLFGEKEIAVITL
jgi:hypothetical protein